MYTKHRGHVVMRMTPGERRTTVKPWPISPVNRPVYDTPTVPVDDPGETCAECGAPAIRREIVRKVWPRRYVGACKAHLAGLAKLTAARGRALDGITAEGTLRAERAASVLDESRRRRR